MLEKGEVVSIKDGGCAVTGGNRSRSTSKGEPRFRAAIGKFLVPSTRVDDILRC